jgi:hypothetical protein
MLPQKIGNYVFYVQLDRRTVREVVYTYELDEFVSNEANILSKQITGEGVIDMAYQQAPYNMLWCVLEDGDIAIMTRQIEQQVKGWAKIKTDGDFESVAVIAGEPPS